MKKSKLLALICIVVSFCFSLVPFGTLAQRMQPIVEPGVDLNIQMDASNDNEATWHSYYGDGALTGETLNAKAGDQVTFRIKTWNEDSNNLTTLTYAAECDYPLYFTGPTEFYNPDIDGNLAIYDGDWSGGVTLESVQGNTAENSGAEAGSVKVFLKNDVPDQTTINCVIAVTNYGGGPNGGPQSSINKKGSAFSKLAIQKAWAQSQAYSAVRILVNNAPLPQTGAKL